MKKLLLQNFSGTKLHFLVGLILLFANSSFSQTITISGQTTVQPGATEYYEAQFDYSVNPYANLTWTVSGGTIISQSINPTSTVYCTIEWDNNDGTGSVSLYEDLNSITGGLLIEIGDQPATCPQADAGPDAMLCSGGILIGVPAVSGFNYSWSPTLGLDNPNIAQPFADPAVPTTYTLTMSPQNLIPNGDFEAGMTGFNTDYGTFPNGDNLCSLSGFSWGSVGVTTSPNLFGSAWCNIPDHSANGDKMLFVDGSCGTNRRVWWTTVPVVSGTTYYFTGYAIGLIPGSTFNPVSHLPQLRVLINGQAIIQNFTLTYASCTNWLQLSGSWISNSNWAQIEIIDDSHTSSGNDFCLDDLMFTDCFETTDNVNITIDPNRVVITPGGPIEYYTETDYTPYGFTLTSNQTSGNQWYMNNQAIAGATNQTLFTGYLYNMGNTYYVMANGCRSNTVSVSYQAYGYGNFGEEQFYFGSKMLPVFPHRSNQYYCKNTPNSITNFNLGAGATYTWNFTPWGTGGPYAQVLNYNPAAYYATIFVGNVPTASSNWDWLCIQGIGDKNGVQKIIDYNIRTSSSSTVDSRSVCASEQVEIINSNTSNSGTDRKAGESGFDVEVYEFGPNCTITSPASLAGAGPRTFSLPGRTPLAQPLKVQFSGTSYYKTYFYYQGNEQGCYRKEINITTLACRGVLESNSEISIFPNPSNSAATIKSTNIISQVEIVDLFYYPIKVIKINNTRQALINTAELKPGIYFCKVTTNKGIEFLKLLIER